MMRSHSGILLVGFFLCGTQKKRHCFYRVYRVLFVAVVVVVVDDVGESASGRVRFRVVSHRRSIHCGRLVDNSRLFVCPFFMEFLFLSAPVSLALSSPFRFVGVRWLFPALPFHHIVDSNENKTQTKRRTTSLKSTTLFSPEIARPSEALSINDDVFKKKNHGRRRLFIGFPFVVPSVSRDCPSPVGAAAAAVAGRQSSTATTATSSSTPS